MAVTYTNTWKNVLVALKSKIKAEMKCPVLSGFDETSKANQFIILTPLGSEQGDVTSKSEHRTFNIDIHYYFINRNNQQFQDYILNQISIFEALIHDNPTLSLSDSTTAYNLRSGNNEINIEQAEGYEDYLVTSWDFSCEHLNNLG
tara:strand:+ start:184 stop:621 length:438 start_codon:yes stop_codon:yes gene_type:complete